MGKIVPDSKAGVTNLTKMGPAPLFKDNDGGQAGQAKFF
jgi:hypothetical protein